MRIARTLLLGSALVAFGGACADLPTTSPGEAGPVASLSQTSSTLGEINVAAVYEHPDRWEVNLSTASSTTISSRQWQHGGGVGYNPWGNGAYKYIVNRYKSSGPGCVVVELRTNFTNGTVKYDYEEVRLGGYTGICAWPF